MVKRRGLGATMAASVAFAVILVAGLAVYVSSQGREGLYSTADSEDALGDGFHVLAAAAGFDELAGVQGIFTSQVLACDSASAAVHEGVESLSDAQSYGNVTVTSSAALAPGGAAADNLSALSPYAGSVPGSLDLALTFVGSGSAGPAVTLDRTETHYAHLGVRLDGAVRDCMGIFRAVMGAVHSLKHSNCSSAPDVIDEAVQGSVADAEAQGFQVGVHDSATSAPTCQVSFTVRVQQPSVQGPCGAFTARFEEQGSYTAGT
ncbi:MAG: hypothetical protein KGI26_05070 [Thaumarchaeota archaeon]|nr:hypothetical protein [Nitrososphaerota archaeon]